MAQYEGEVSVFDEADGSADAALVTRCLQGDTHAFGLLFDRYAQRVHAITYRIATNPDDADDLSQETFLQAFRALGTLQQPQAFAAWLYRIATNVSLDAQRRHKPLTFPAFDQYAGNQPDEDRSSSPDEVSLATDDSRSVLDALALLSPKQRAALTLREMLGMSYGEIATTLGLTAGAVEVLLVRGRRRFRDHFERLASAPATCTRSATAARVALDGAAAPTTRQDKAAASHARTCATCRAEVAHEQQARRARALLPLLPVPAALKPFVLLHGLPAAVSALTTTVGPAAGLSGGALSASASASASGAGAGSAAATASGAVSASTSAMASAGTAATGLGIKAAVLVGAKAALVVAGTVAVGAVAGAALIHRAALRPSSPVTVTSTAVASRPATTGAPASTPTGVVRAAAVHAGAARARGPARSGPGPSGTMSRQGLYVISTFTTSTKAHGISTGTAHVRSGRSVVHHPRAALSPAPGTAFGLASGAPTPLTGSSATRPTASGTRAGDVAGRTPPTQVTVSTATMAPIVGTAPTAVPHPPAPVTRVGHGSRSSTGMGGGPRRSARVGPPSARQATPSPAGTGQARTPVAVALSSTSVAVPPRVPVLPRTPAPTATTQAEHAGRAPTPALGPRPTSSPQEGTSLSPVPRVTALPESTPAPTVRAQDARGKEHAGQFGSPIVAGRNPRHGDVSTPTPGPTSTDVSGGDNGPTHGQHGRDGGSGRGRHGGPTATPPGPQPTQDALATEPTETPEASSHGGRDGGGAGRPVPSATPVPTPAAVSGPSFQATATPVPADTPSTDGQHDAREPQPSVTAVGRHHDAEATAQPIATVTPAEATVPETPRDASSPASATATVSVGSTPGTTGYAANSTATSPSGGDEDVPPGATNTTGPAVDSGYPATATPAGD